MMDIINVGCIRTSLCDKQCTYIQKYNSWYMYQFIVDYQFIVLLRLQVSVCEEDAG